MLHLALISLAGSSPAVKNTLLPDAVKVAAVKKSDDKQAKKPAVVQPHTPADKDEDMADKIAAKVIKKLSMVNTKGSCTAAGPSGSVNLCGFGFQCSSGQCGAGDNCCNCGTYGFDDCGFDAAFVAACASSPECQGGGGECTETADCDGTDVCKAGKCIPNPQPPPSAGSCFAKDASTACLLASPNAECEHVRMADLAVGDLVLGRTGATTVLAVQHKAADTVAELLTFHTADNSVSMTADHAVFADGQLIAAGEVKVGSLLSTGAVKRITKSEGTIINPITFDGTIVANGILAASNPYWVAALTVDAPLTRTIMNAAFFAAGDVDSIAAGFGGILAKIGLTLALVALAKSALKKGCSRTSSK